LSPIVRLSIPFYYTFFLPIYHNTKYALILLFLVTKINGRNNKTNEKSWLLPEEQSVIDIASEKIDKTSRGDSWRRRRSTLEEVPSFTMKSAHWFTSLRVWETATLIWWSNHFMSWIRTTYIWYLSMGPLIRLMQTRESE